MTDTSNLSDPVRRAVESLDKKRQRLVERDSLARVAEQAVEQFDVAKAIDVCELFADVTVLCECESVHDVAPLLRWFAHQGYRQADEPHDVAQSNSRVWPLGDRSLRVQARFSSSGQCRYVQVGEKTEPVYELRCDGDEQGAERVVSKGVEQAERDVSPAESEA